MAERRLIYNSKGVQLGYIEASAAFDLSGKERCSYTGATGNLSDSNSGKIIGHISLDGTFVGVSWISDQLFGKPSGDARADRPARVRAGSRRAPRASVKRSESVPKRAVSPQQSDSPVTPAQVASETGSNPETGLSASDQVADRVPALPSSADQEPSQGAPSATASAPAENELLDRAIGMIRSALEKERE
jgi:hypothetical protein